ncbi:beta-galactosidase [Streptomyces sp. NPDC059255]|uniref:beta-galactosidase n=1 Tax=Streptomyces sp. NPDC059255 TaxID=3346793 RepID=UPI00367879BC
MKRSPEPSSTQEPPVVLSLRTHDLTAPPAGPTGHLRMGSPDGVPAPLVPDSRRILRGRVPWLPVMAEFHFSRYPAAEWREELLKIRAGGVDTVATYLFWNQHEETRGTFRFDDGLDVRRFVLLCAGLGLSVAVRVGPWSHGECRGGGFPDWLDGAGCVPRTDDPAYLALVERYFARIGHELRGLSYDEGGPVVAVQIENELYDAPGHLATLRRVAAAAGIAAPLWTATGWDAADLPRDVLLPVYGGYPEAFWLPAHDGWAREMRRHYVFTPVRDDPNIGADLRPAVRAGHGVPDDGRYPYITCELGSGMAVAYHRRPLVRTADVSALALAKLGSGSVWQGYYLYHGCSQRLDLALPNQESHATGYPNDLPSVSYDFQAPLGEYGQVRPSFHALRAQHLLIQDSGARLADMPLRLPDVTPAGLDDRSTLRWAVRSSGTQGFLFVNNHQPHEPLPDHREVRFWVELDGHARQLPATPVTVPGGAHFVWPLGYEAGPGVRLDWVSAQPLTRLEIDGVPTAVFAATAGITPQFPLPAGAVVSGPARTAGRDGAAVVEVTAPGTDAAVTVTGPAGPVRLLFLTEEQGRRLQRVRIWGAERLVLCDDAVLADGGELRVHTEAETVSLSLAPAPATAIRATGSGTPGADPAGARTAGSGPPALSRPRADGLFTTWTAPAPRVAGAGAVTVDRVRARAVAPPARDGGSQRRASAPVDADFAEAAVHRIAVPAAVFDEGGEVLLRLTYTGDVARAFIGGRLVADHFWHGPAWDIGLRRHAAAAVEHGVEIRVLPLGRASGVYVDPSARHGLAAARTRASVDSAALVPVRRIRLRG